MLVEIGTWLPIKLFINSMHNVHVLVLDLGVPGSPMLN